MRFIIPVHDLPQLPFPFLEFFAAKLLDGFDFRQGEVLNDVLDLVGILLAANDDWAPTDHQLDRSAFRQGCQWS